MCVNLNIYLYITRRHQYIRHKDNVIEKYYFCIFQDGFEKINDQVSLQENFERFNWGNENNYSIIVIYVRKYFFTAPDRNVNLQFMLSRVN